MVCLLWSIMSQSCSIRSAQGPRRRRVPLVLPKRRGCVPVVLRRRRVCSTAAAARLWYCHGGAAACMWSAFAPRARACGTIPRRRGRSPLHLYKDPRKKEYITQRRQSNNLSVLDVPCKKNMPQLFLSET
jgi:hypothetical protein